MEEKMKKMLFLMLFLLILGAANVNSQVRIGGNGVPNGSAVLDLNATDAINNGTRGLALPRVQLVSTTSYAPLAAHVTGMTVYNTATAGDVTPGVYYNNGTQWVRITINPVTGSDIAADAIDSTKIKNSSVSLADIAPGCDGCYLLYKGGKWVQSASWTYGSCVGDLQASTVETTQFIRCPGVKSALTVVGIGHGSIRAWSVFVPSDKNDTLAIEGTVGISGPRRFNWITPSN